LKKCFKQRSSLGEANDERQGKEETMLSALSIP